MPYVVVQLLSAQYLNTWSVVVTVLRTVLCVDFGRHHSAHVFVVLACGHTTRGTHVYCQAGAVCRRYRRHNRYAVVPPTMTWRWNCIPMHRYMRSSRSRPLWNHQTVVLLLVPKILLRTSLLTVAAGAVGGGEGEVGTLQLRARISMSS